MKPKSIIIIIIACLIMEIFSCFVINKMCPELNFMDILFITILQNTFCSLFTILLCEKLNLLEKK